MEEKETSGRAAGFLEKDEFLLGLQVGFLTHRLLCSRVEFRSRWLGGLRSWGCSPGFCTFEKNREVVP